jgi:hypothetical protein
VAIDYSVTMLLPVDVRDAGRAVRLSGTELIAPVRFAETVLHSPAWLATVPSSETPRPVIPASTTAVAAIVRTGRAVARTIAWRRRTVTATITRRRRAVARVRAEIKIDALG